jgi:hypothetical protein
MVCGNHYLGDMALESLQGHQERRYHFGPHCLFKLEETRLRTVLGVSMKDGGYADDEEIAPGIATNSDSDASDVSDSEDGEDKDDKEEEGEGGNDDAERIVVDADEAEGDAAVPIIDVDDYPSLTSSSRKRQRTETKEEGGDTSAGATYMGRATVPSRLLTNYLSDPDLCNILVDDEPDTEKEVGTDGKHPIKKIAGRWACKCMVKRKGAEIPWRTSAGLGNAKQHARTCQLQRAQRNIATFFSKTAGWC